MKYREWKYRVRSLRPGAQVAVAVLCGALVALGVAGHLDERVSHSETLTQTFTNFSSERNLTDFCHRIMEVPGVSGVRIGNYDAAVGSATITIFFDRRVVSTETLRVILKNNKIVWAAPRSV
jgi:hypothetical protein